MHDAGFVGMMEGFGDLRAEFDGLSNCQRMSFDPLIEAGTIDEITGDVNAAVFTSHFVD